MRRALALVCAAAVSTTLLVQTPTARSAPDPDGAEAVLKADADGPVRIRREGGVATFVGTPAGTDVDNPGVGKGTTVSAAARSHLRRYGAVIGADRSGTALKETGHSRSAAGTDVVRFQQEVDGLPVIGGEVVVTLAGDHDLGSLNGNLSVVEQVPASTVSESRARAIAVGVVGRSAAGSPVADDLGRWLFDPEAVSWPGAVGARGVWRFEVRGGHGVRRMVFVDDRTGAVLLNVDLIQEADRVVCDRDSLKEANPAPCTTGFDRTEASGPSAVADVEDAFTNAGVVSEFYDQVSVWDLTDMIGLDTASGRHLSSSVRVCLPDDTDDPGTCPYANAYWNGQAMFYGEGYAAADDVVGHEMTHGVIERSSNLLYWDQSGAINESLADIIGEIVDHRNVVDGEAATWTVGEDLPDGALRDFADPEAYDQPNRMTSNLWDDDPTYSDNGGVHTNSGVGNKAFHLISQGGSFNGQTITGIDADDPMMAKSAALWLQVMATVNAFTEYDDLALVLDQACTALVGSGDLAASDCVAVRQATVAVEMDQQPAVEPFRDASRSCPLGSAKRVLFDSESGPDPASKFWHGAGWGRTPGTSVNSDYGVNAYSGDTAWVAEDVPTPYYSELRSLRKSSSLLLPPSTQPTYLAFRHWHVFEYDIDPVDGDVRFWDGGYVQLDRHEVGVYSLLSSEPWLNGPQKRLEPNPTDANPPFVFGGSGGGWYGSRVDLTRFGGETVTPMFVARLDKDFGAPGWYVDDIEMFTCDPALTSTGSPVISAAPRFGRGLSVTGVSWSHPSTVTSYQWRRNGVAIPGAISNTYWPVVTDIGKSLSVAVTGQLGDQTKALTAVASGTVLPGIITPPPAVYTNGRARVGLRLTASPGTWKPSGVTFRYRWTRDGKPITGATGRTYLLRRVDRGHRVAVRIAGVKAGYTSVTRRSAAVLVRR